MWYLKHSCETQYPQAWEPYAIHSLNEMMTNYFFISMFDPLILLVLSSSSILTNLVHNY